MKILLCLAFTMLAAPLLSRVYAQGSLTPPGPPAPTMHTLDEISSDIDSLGDKVDLAIQQSEQRIPISGPIVINAPGSYYLTRNISGVTANKATIEINSSNVTIDLNGFSVSNSGLNGAGISANGSFKQIVVRNGIVHDCAGRGVNIASADHVRLEYLTSSNNATGFIVSNGTAVLSHCVADFNNGDGIQTGSDCVIEHCLAKGNANQGISTANGCSIVHSTAGENGGIGFQVGNGCTLHACSSYLNLSAGIVAPSPNGSGVTIMGCAVRDNKSVGIFVNQGGHIEQNAVSHNDDDGIRLSDNSYVVGNTCENNGGGNNVTNGAGIHTFPNGRGNRIDGNNLVNNHIGVRCESDGNLIIRNSSRGGTAAYSLAAGNSEGPEVNVFNPNATTTIASTNPWANFLY